ncbi:MAG: BatD family protein [Planctomycetota bacterium]|jgi:hypothetical protein
MATGLARKYLTVLLICPGLLWLGSGCRQAPDTQARTEFEIDKLYELGPLTAHVRLSKSKITIAETLLVEFETALGPGFELQMPKVSPELLKDFGIVDWQSLGSRLDENNSVVSTYQYRLEPFLSGTYQIPSFTFDFHDVNDPENKKHELITDAIDIEVTSLLGEDREKLTIADIEDVVEMPAAPSYWWAWTTGAVIIVAAGTLLWYWRSKRQAKLVRILRPAHEIAYDRLRALVKDDLVNAGRIKEFYERVSDILRHYIEHRFDLRAPERTTEEFLIELQWTDALGESDKQDLGEFLSHCDLVKFARHSPTAEQIQRTFDLVKAFIEKTKSDDRTIDVTDTIKAQQAVEVGSA